MDTTIKKEASSSELEPPSRFSRQREFVPPDKLESVRFLIVGLGAIGRQVAVQLGAIGGRVFYFVDFDRVEEHNMATQGFRDCDLDDLKIHAVASVVQEADKSIEIHTFDKKWSPSLIPVEEFDAVFCCVDSIDARKYIWSKLKDEPTLQFWVDGRMLGETMEVIPVNFSNPAEIEGYQNSLFDAEDAVPGRCTAKSTIYTASIAAGLMVHQFTRFLRGQPGDHVLLNLQASDMVVIEPSGEDRDSPPPEL